jgi:hypothetical protein
LEQTWSSTIALEQHHCLGAAALPWSSRRGAPTVEDAACCSRQTGASLEPYRHHPRVTYHHCPRPAPAPPPCPTRLWPVMAWQDRAWRPRHLASPPFSPSPTPRHPAAPPPTFHGPKQSAAGCTLPNPTRLLPHRGPTSRRDTTRSMPQSPPGRHPDPAQPSRAWPPGPSRQATTSPPAHPAGGYPRLSDGYAVCLPDIRRSGGYPRLSDGYAVCLPDIRRSGGYLRLSDGCAVDAAC